MLGRVFRYQGWLWRALNTLTDILALSVLWLLCSSPVLTLGAATTALYDSVVRCIRYKQSGPYERFFRTFKNELVPGLLLTLLFRCRCGGFDVFFGLRFGLGNVQAFHTAPVGIGFDLGGRCLREDVLLHGVGLRERTGSNDSILRGAIIGCQRGRCHPGESKSGRGERSNHGTMLNMLHRILSLQHPSYKKRGTVVGRETQ